LPSQEAGITATPDARPFGAIPLIVQGEPAKPRVLVYTYESYWRHYSNTDSFVSILNMVQTRGFSFAQTSDPLAINATNLANHDVLESPMIVTGAELRLLATGKSATR
jgi:hypothetical protein